MPDRTCLHCGVDISELHRNSKFCSASCRGAVAYARRRRVPCQVCGGPTGWPAGRVESATCNPCRRSNWQHGTEGGYRKGCRCKDCRRAKREAMKAYITLVKKRDGVSPRVKYRKTPDVFCADCGERLRFGGGGGSTGDAPPRCLSCSRKRPRIPMSVRGMVYERDGYVCQLCGDPTDPDADPYSEWYPTLDHIEPYSLGGSDSPENLRTAHRWCNGIRGVGDPHKLFEGAS